MGYYISGPVISLTFMRSGSPAIESCDGARKYAELHILFFSFLKNNRTCVLKVEAIFEASHFSKQTPFRVVPRFEPGTSVSSACCLGT